jgi:hypothetical protein
MAPAMSALPPHPPRHSWQAPDGDALKNDDRRRPSTVATAYKGPERRLRRQPMFQDPAGNTDLSKPGASEGDAK